MLARPLVTAGELEYRGGERLAKRIDRPYRETTEIDGHDVRVRRDGQTPRRFSLDRAPELRGMLASFAGLLAGDREALETWFTVALAPGDAWTITLAPKQPRLAKRIAAIEMQGKGDVPRCVWVREPDGDATLSLLGEAGKEPVARDARPEALASRCR